MGATPEARFFRASASGGNPDMAARRRRARHAADRRLHFYGAAAICIGLGFLLALILALLAKGHPAFTQTMVRVDVDLSTTEIDRDNPRDANWRAISRQAYRSLVPHLPRSHEHEYFALFTANGHHLLREAVLADPSMLTGPSHLLVPLADPADQLAKGVIRRDLPAEQRRISDVQLSYLDLLEKMGLLTRPFNHGLIFNSDSRFPELAGLRGAIAGSFWLLTVCFLISFPLGIAAAIHLEDFAPKNRLTDFIEININNLAAVPSIIFGLLGLAIFLGWFGLPRSTPLVGGLVLSLMTLPTIIIITRSALQQVPHAIMEAAFALGASKHQAVLHHKLPLAMPSILTGTIIGMAQALGETAPLLLIGMNAFIAGTSGGIADPSTALPTQIYIWSDSPERGFVSRTAAAILILLGFLVAMNSLALYLRQRLARKW